MYVQYPCFSEKGVILTVGCPCFCDKRGIKSVKYPCFREKGGIFTAVSPCFCDERGVKMLQEVLVFAT